MQFTKVFAGGYAAQGRGDTMWYITGKRGAWTLYRQDGITVPTKLDTKPTKAACITLARILA